MKLNELKLMLRIFQASPADLHRGYLQPLNENELVRFPIGFPDRALSLPHQALASVKWEGSHVLDSQEVILKNLEIYRKTKEESAAKVMENYLLSKRYMWCSDFTRRKLFIDFPNTAVVVHEAEEREYRINPLRKEIIRSFYFSYGNGSLDTLLEAHGDAISSSINRYAKDALTASFNYSEQLREMEYRTSVFEKLHSNYAQE